MRGFLLPLLAASCFVAAPAAAQPGRAPAFPAPVTTPAPPTVPDAFRVSVRRELRDDGLRIVLDPRPDAATVTLCASYAVGIRDERDDEAGLVTALAERLRRPQDVEPTVAARGGHGEHWVGLELTEFCTTLPAAELALAVWAEALRFEPPPSAAPASPTLGLTPGEAARAGGLAQLARLAYLGSYDVSLPAAHLSSDAQRLALVDLHRSTFQPSRAVWTFSGGFEPARALALVTAARRTPSAPVREAAVPRPVIPQRTERFAAIQDERVHTATLFAGWRLPASSVDARALQVAAALLAGGEGSLLHQELVVRSRVARSVAASTQEPRAPGLFVLELGTNLRTPHLALERALQAHLHRLAVAGPTPAEHERARAQVVSELLGKLEDGTARARWLGELEQRSALSEGALEREVAAVLAVTPEDLRRAVGNLTATRCSWVEVHPRGWPTGGGARPAAAIHIVDAGETLGSIARAFGVSIAELASENKLDPRRPIFPGQKLRLPRGAKRPAGAGGTTKAPATQAAPVYVVVRGDTLTSIARRHGVSTAALSRANGLSPKQTLRVGQRLALPIAVDSSAPGPKGKPSAAEPKPGAAEPKGKPSAAEGKPGAAEPKGKPSAAEGKPGAEEPKGKPGAEEPKGKPGAAEPKDKPSAAEPKGKPSAAEPKGKPGAAEPKGKPNAPELKSGRPEPKSKPGAEPEGKPEAEPKGKPDATEPAAPVAKPRVHTVRSGETLGSIANRYGVSVVALARANGIDTKRMIRPGQQLTIPARTPPEPTRSR